MKTSVKILILFLAVVIAVGGILLYMKIISAPPMKMGDKNQYTEYLGSLTSTLKDSVGNKAEDMEYLFQKAADITDRFNQENLITTDEGVKSYGDFILVYAPKFSQWCLVQLRQPQWNNEQLNWMAERIDFLNGVKNTGNEALLKKENPSTSADLDTVKNTVAKYHEALQIAAGGFKSLEDSRSRISRSKSLMNDQYLRNNASLMSSLQGLPSSLERGHVASLKNQVASLANYKNYNQDSYNTLSDRVYQSISQYQANASSTYGHTSDISDLRRQASKYMSDAEDYFALMKHNKRVEQESDLAAPAAEATEVRPVTRPRF